MPPETETAMDGARPSCYDQESGLDTSPQPGAAAGRRPRPADRARNRGASASFALPGQDLHQQRIVGVARTDAGQVGLRHEQRKAAGRLVRPRPPTRAEGRAGGKVRPDRGPPRPGSIASRRRRAAAAADSTSSEQVPIDAQSYHTRPIPESETENQTWPATTPAISARA